MVSLSPHEERMCYMKLICCVVASLTLVFNIPDVGAVESVRTQEINQCLNDELVTWGDGKDRPAFSNVLEFAYNHADAPSWFAKSLVTGMIAKSTSSWSQCGVKSWMIEQISTSQLRDNVIRVQWSDKISGGNFGLANLSKRTLTLNPKAFELLKNRNPSYDSRETLQMVISHEMGHFFGLMAHSRRCVDVLSYYDNGKGDRCYSRDPAGMGSVIEYRSLLPTACDIQRCRVTNGNPPLFEGRLIERPLSR